MVVDYSNNFLLTLQDILNPDLSLIFGKNACNKIIFPIFAFLIIAAGLYKTNSPNIFQSKGDYVEKVLHFVL